MKITIKDVAKECGVSPATVSLALSNKPSRVSAATKKRIVEAASRLRYQPNQAAVSLVTKQSKLIGVLINDLTSSHIASLFMSIYHPIQARGYAPICYVLNDEKEEDNYQIIKQLAASGIAGIIWGKTWTYSDQEIEFSLIEDIKRIGVPVVAMDECGFSCSGADVIFNYFQAGYLATQHLIEFGHTRIGCVIGPMNYKVTQERLKGYQKALKEAGIPYDKDLIFHGNYTMLSGSESLSYLLGQKVTAIFSFNDEMAFGIYQSARQYGIKIPKDISLIGCDDIPFSNVMEVPLSTIHVPIEDMGSIMGTELIRAIEKEIVEPRRTIEYQPKLLLRGSTIRLK